MRKYGLWNFVYQKALNKHFTPVFLIQNNLFEYTTREHKFQRWFCTQNWVETFVSKISDIKGVKNISEQSVTYLVQLWLGYA